MLRELRWQNRPPHSCVLVSLLVSPSDRHPWPTFRSAAMVQQEPLSCDDTIHLHPALGRGFLFKTTHEPKQGCPYWYWASLNPWLLHNEPTACPDRRAFRASSQLIRLGAESAEAPSSCLQRYPFAGCLKRFPRDRGRMYRHAHRPLWRDCIEARSFGFRCCAAVRKTRCMWMMHAEGRHFVTMLPFYATGLQRSWKREHLAGSTCL